MLICPFRFHFAVFSIIPVVDAPIPDGKIRRIDITKQKPRDGNGAEKSALFFSQRREADSRNNSIF